MFRYFFLIFIAPFISGREQSQSQNKKLNNDDIRAITVTYNLPIINRDGRILNHAAYINLYFHNNLILYQIPYRIDSAYNGKHIETKIVNQFFVCEKNHKEGYIYDEHRLYRNKKISTDSVLNKFGFTNVKKFYQLFEKGSLMLVATNKNSVTGVLQEIYIPKEKVDISYCDSAFFYFSEKLKEIDFSFIKELDSIKQSKLFRIKLLYNSTFSKEYRVNVSKREFNFEFKEMPVTNSKEILDYFERFRKDYHED